MDERLLETTLDLIPPRVVAQERLVAVGKESGKILFLTDRKLSSDQVRQLEDELQLRLGCNIDVQSVDSNSASEFRKTVDYCDRHEDELTDISYEMPPPVTTRRATVISIGCTKREREKLSARLRRDLIADSIVHVSRPEQVYGLVACSEQPVGMIIVSPELAGLEELLNDLSGLNVTVAIVMPTKADRGSKFYSETDLRKLYLDDPHPWPFSNQISTPPPPVNNPVRNASHPRLFSLWGSLLLLISAPFIAAIGLCILISSGRPVFCRQVRLGKDRRPFLMYRFRTMQKSTIEYGSPNWVLENDPRVTRFGRFLRRVRLDELPQVFNVFLGEMKLIGPRPLHEALSERLEKSIAEFDSRYEHAPGITGASQIILPPDECLDDVKLRLFVDREFSKHQTIWRNIRILIGTVFFTLQAPRSLVARVAGLGKIEAAGDEGPNQAESKSLFSLMPDGEARLQVSKCCKIYPDS